MLLNNDLAVIYLADFFRLIICLLYTSTLPIGSKSVYVITVDSYNDGGEADEASQKIIEKLQEIIDGLQSVSYTHLDVYKRQVQPFS